MQLFAKAVTALLRQNAGYVINEETPAQGPGYNMDN